MPLQDGLRMLKSIHGLSSIAAGAALRAGRSPCEALMALEHGRCCSYDVIIDAGPAQTARQGLVNHRNAVQARINAV